MDFYKKNNKILLPGESHSESEVPQKQYEV
jgi:hypothetical protein